MLKRPDSADFRQLFLNDTPLIDTRAPVPLHKITSGKVAGRRVILYLHGGAYFSGSGRTHLGLLSRLSRLNRLHESHAPKSPCHHRSLTRIDRRSNQ